MQNRCPCHALRARQGFCTPQTAGMAPPSRGHTSPNGKEVAISVSKRLRTSPIRQEGRRLDAKRQGLAKHPEELPEDLRLPFSLQRKKRLFDQAFDSQRNQDYKARPFLAGSRFSGYVLFIDGMADNERIDDYILKPCMQTTALANCPAVDVAQVLQNQVLQIGDLVREAYAKKAVQAILDGLCVLIVEGMPDCFVMDVRGYERRSVGTPQTENVIAGPHEAFTENLRTNVTLIRRNLRSSDLVTELLANGGQNNQQLAVLYRSAVVDAAMLRAIKQRIGDIHEYLVMGHGMVKQALDTRPYSLFSQILATERPDRVAAFLMEGYVALVVDGSPFVLVLPVTFFAKFHAPDDSYLRWPQALTVRIVRMLGLLLSLLLPGLYLASISYHSAVMPMEFILSVMSSRLHVSIPLVLELLLLTIAFELVLEAGFRIPGGISQTIGIVGALILGQAAVEANIVSPVVIIVVALTALGGFALPSYEMQQVSYILRFGFILAAALAGFVGIALGFLLLLCYLCTLEAFGLPYFAPLSPEFPHNGDVLLRKPLKGNTGVSEFVRLDG